MLIDDTDRRILRQALAEPLAARILWAERAGVTLATLAPTGVTAAAAAVHAG